MRRRSRMKTLKRLWLLSQGRFHILFILTFLCQLTASKKPGYLDFDNLPETNFTCAGKVIGGYYADLETSCQMFHVCTIGAENEPMDIKFLCLNGTVFDQETRVCERVDEVDCSKSERFYYLNLELYGNTIAPAAEDSSENTTQKPKITTSTTARITTKTTVTPTTTASPSTTTKSTPTTTRRTYSSQTTRPSAQPTRTPLYKASPGSTIKKLQAVPSSTISPSQTNFVSTTQTPSNGDDDEEYEYEDDYPTTDGKVVPFNHHNQPPSNQPNNNNNNNNNNMNLNTYALNQFLFHNNNDAKDDAASPNSPQKPAISFQHQQFQNGDKHSVTNSHVTVTTHSSQTSTVHPKLVNNNLNSNRLSNSPVNSIKKEPTPHVINGYSTSGPSQYNYFDINQALAQSLKRIPLQLPPTGGNGNNQQQYQQSGEPIRLKAQGFTLPPSLPNGNHPTDLIGFDGYHRHTPQIFYLPHNKVSLQLPNEHVGREQKEILGFEDNVAFQEERKDLKRSEQATLQQHHSQQPTAAATEHHDHHNDAIKVEITTTMETLRHDATSVVMSERADDDDDHHNHNNPTDQQRLFSNKAAADHQAQQEEKEKQDRASSNVQVLLTPQNRFIPTLPKVIITASASVSDGTGKKINYSVGSVLGNTKKIRAPPSTYDEYKEDDVILDPFFIDVPKIHPRGKRDLKLQL